ncbi:hypothetical protein CALCODRAFT_54708 [Calocera cornea HHB12733]|uniref:Uncharacterized protein n=1 Tax=Calocera cornea HHB12733 TaxID=1353952 RepID=A0A165DR23_9BASI|nr:hypothetical protein CALCODRAFT_54708 [Calocera cornea HHB12733]
MRSAGWSVRAQRLRPWPRKRLFASAYHCICFRGMILLLPSLVWWSLLPLLLGCGTASAWDIVGPFQVLLPWWGFYFRLNVLLFPLEKREVQREQTGGLWRQPSSAQTEADGPGRKQAPLSTEQEFCPG